MHDSVSLAFLTILERLSPVERAVFLLRHVFDYEHDEIAAIVGDMDESWRPRFARAKRPIEKRDELAQRFFAACQEGRLDDVATLLSTNAAFYGDGGGKVVAVMRPVLGRDRVARLLYGIFDKGKAIAAQLTLVDVNGQPGAMTFDSQGRLINVLALDVADGAVRAVRCVINPDKLRHFLATGE